MDNLKYEEIPSKPQEKDPYHHHIWDFTYSMDINTYLTYLPWKFLSKLVFAKVWLKNTLPTYSLDICPNFRSFFLDPSLRQLH